MYSYVQFCRAQLYTRLLYTTVRNVMLSVAASFISRLALAVAGRGGAGGRGGAPGGLRDCEHRGPAGAGAVLATI